MAPAGSGWTGGQYSLFRGIFGLYVFVHFAGLIPWGAELFSSSGVLPEASASPLLHLFPNVLALADTPGVVTALLVIATVLSLLFAVGWHDRLAAGLLWYVLACLHGRNPLIANPSLPFVGWMLLAHVALPAAPYGSWAARGRPDPRGVWRMPRAIAGAAWIVMALAYSYSGYTKLVSPSWLDGTAVRRVLENPLARPGVLHDALLAAPDWFLALQTWGAMGAELLFAPLALFARLRPWLWGLLLAMQLGLLGLIDFADLSLGMVMLHLFTFDPAWVRPAAARGPERLFYDGTCGLCHRAVRFVLAEDRSGQAFRFAPIAGATFEAAVPDPVRASLPESLVLERADGTLLARSAAVLHVLARLGGLWRVTGALALLVPRRLRDAAYDGVARVRRRLFRPPPEACPVVPAELRSRFDG
jgi:predicted DCC family thiol-disulfide oxidoreductase YuxK